MKRNIIAIIMGGGRGTRLHPLTRERCKPAVPLAGKYRLVDIPISNCINSGLNQIFVLTQFNTASLHRHIQESYKFDPFGGGFVDILSAEQTETGENWYQGTADAVRQNMHHFGGFNDNDLFLILSGDQLYRMDFTEVIRQHDESGADITIAAKPIGLHEAEGLGLMRVGDDLSVSEFVEKPTDPEVIQGLAVGDSVRAKMSQPGDRDYCLASMGIYVFNRKTLSESLKSDTTDFGKEIIPGLLGKTRMTAFIFDGYWEDIGTVRAFFECNLRLTDDMPPFNFFDETSRVFTRARFLPASKVNSASIDHVVMAGGCIITETTLKRCVIGVRSKINPGCRLENVVMMGADYFETQADIEENVELGRPPVGVGRNCRISGAILDKNVRIGDNVVLNAAGKENGFSEGPVVIRDGVLLVCKDGVIPDGTVI